MGDHNTMQDKSIISQILETEVPENLYHYTSSNGLMGIIGTEAFHTGKIWATKIQYMNDGSELQHGFEQIKKEIETQKKYIRDEIEVQDGYRKRTTDELDDMLSALERIAHINIGVVSFTTEGDQLSQWRGYCKIGNGYSLCFSGEKLCASIEKLKDAEKLPEILETLQQNIGKLPEDLVRKPVYYLVPCKYEEYEHSKMVKELISFAPIYNEQYGPYPNTPKLWRIPFEEAAVFIAAMIKAEGFKEEKEWRLICGPFLSNDSEYRSGNYSLIPYWVIDLDLKNALKKIIIGPTPEKELSKNALHGYLRRAYSVGPRGTLPIPTENSKIYWKSI